MYKTVRHGENSLQYTILPQTEEVLDNSGLKGKGRDYSPSIHVRRSRRKSTCKYVVLIVFGVMIALALASIPLYVMNGTLFARRNHRDSNEITNSPLTPTGREIVKSRKKELKNVPEVAVPEATPSLEGIIMSTSSVNVTSKTLPETTSTRKSEYEHTAAGVWPMPPVRSKQSYTSTSTVRTSTKDSLNSMNFIGMPSSIQLYDNIRWEDVAIKSTVTPEPITFKNAFIYYSRMHLSSAKPSVIPNGKVEELLITKITTTMRPQIRTETTSEMSNLKDLKETLLSVDDDEEFKESLEVDDVFSLPPLKPEPGDAGEADEVTVSKAVDVGWYGARWPFVDTSSYFQWTGYSSGDNLLLPLLVAALSSIALVLLLALAVRRRKRSQTALHHIGQLAADTQADDNTNLLTAENREDAEE